jgi:hypothetical protein
MYDIYLHPHIKSQDLDRLPLSLIEDFTRIYQPDLEKTPYPESSSIRKHLLPNKPLNGYYSIDIKWEEEFEGDFFTVNYRIVYGIEDVNRRVYIISFAEHDLAYDSAKQRTKGGKFYKG